MPFLTSRTPPLALKCRVSASCVRSSMTYESVTRPLLVDVGLKFERAEEQMIGWMGGISMTDRRTSEELRRLVGVEPITTVIRSGRLRWYRHVIMKSIGDWVKKCIDFRVESRRPVGRPRRTWLEAYKRWICHSGHKLLYNLCRTLRPSNAGQIYRFFWQAGHVDTLDGWRCSSLIQFRQLRTNESGFAISALNKYMLGSRYP